MGEIGEVVNEKRDALQSKDLWGISRLDTVSFALPGVACDDGKVSTGDGEDCPAIVRVRVKVSLGWVCHVHVKKMHEGRVSRVLSLSRSLNLAGISPTTIDTKIFTNS